ncbi:MAG: hypothetical protein AABY22_07710, partial [Nanoarchaeota archaeon]
VDIITAHDNGYVLLNNGSLSKINEDGSEGWRKDFGSGSSFNDEGSIEKISVFIDGYGVVNQYIIGCTTWSSGNYRGEDRVGDFYLMNASKNGDLNWEKSFRISKGIEHKGYAVKQTVDRGFIFIGRLGWDSTNTYLVKTDKNGSLEWQETYNYEEIDKGVGVQQMSDGSYLILSDAHDLGYDSITYLTNIDLNGNKVWEKKWGWFSSSSLEKTQDKGYIITGNQWIPNNDNYDVYLLKLSGEPPIESPPSIPEPTPTPEPEQKNLVLITHGWNPQLGEYNGWCEDFVERIRNNLHEEHNSSEWFVDSYLWLDDSTKSIPDVAVSGFSDIVTNAFEHGSWLGKGIAELNYNHIHLIGHSVGAWLIHEAAREIRKKDKDASIHLTFLDALIPGREAQSNLLGNLDGNGNIGDNKLWSDNYYVEDNLTGDMTDVDLQYAHNVDLSNIDNSINEHWFPHEWYRDTVSIPNETQGSNIYGFIRSLEGGGESEWNRSLNNSEFSIGNNAVIIERERIGLYELIKNILSASIQGTISPATGGTTLETILSPSPSLAGISQTTQEQTPQSVWLESELNIPENVNYLNFNYQFQGQNPGYVSFYINDNLIHIADQRIHRSEMENSSDIYIGDNLQEGRNILGVRFTEHNSSTTSTSKIFISDLEYGEFRKKRNSTENWIFYE